MAAALLLGACSYTPPDDPSPDGPELPIVTFEIATSLADEGVSLLNIPLKLSTPNTSSVDYQITGGNATPVSDYSFIGGGQNGGTITFAGATANIQVMFQNDGLEEGFETVEITLMNPQGATIGAEDTHVITISPDILPRVKFTNATTSVDEGLVAKLDLELDIEPITTVSIDIALAGNATAVVDYGLTGRTVTFAPGVKTAQLDYAVANDDRDELNEIIAVDLGSPIGLVIDTTAAHTEHTILDDDATPTIEFVNATNTQNENIPTADQIVTLSAPSNLTVTVDYAASGTAANVDDLIVTGTRLTFAPGETMQTIPLTIVNGTVDEQLNQTAVITLSNPNNGLLVVGDNLTHTLTIVDDDPPPTFTFATASTNVAENGATLAVSVTLSAVSEQTVTVDFAPTGTATLDADFTIGNPTTTLTFAPGDPSEDITVTFVNNTIGELDETLDLVLSNASNANPGAITTHTINITDDDCFGTGAFRVCPAAQPAGNKTLSSPFSTDGGECAAQQPVGWTTTQPAACFVIANNITVDAGVLQVTGTRPLVLVGRTSVTVNGTIDASANGSTNGPGAPSTDCDNPSTAENHVDGGGGGAGASFMSVGGNGGDGDASSPQADGGNAPPAETADPAILRGGCSGQTGGTGPGAGGLGGGAGGAVYIVATTITIGGGIDVSGSGGLGGSNDAGAGGGGGAGGTIFLDALTTLNANGFLMANGGGGGQGADADTTGGSGQDPSSPGIVALGGQLGSAGGIGGNGLFTAVSATSATNATPGLDGVANRGAGGGGGGGGFIKSTKSLANASGLSAGKVVAP